MNRYQRHIFVCVNSRPDDHPRGCCHSKGSQEVKDWFSEELKKRGISTLVRANNAGCLDACEFGSAIVIYPEGIWYGGVKKEDVVEIIDRTIVNGEVIQRLLIENHRFNPPALQFKPLNVKGHIEGNG